MKLPLYNPDVFTFTLLSEGRPGVALVPYNKEMPPSHTHTHKISALTSLLNFLIVSDPHVYFLSLSRLGLQRVNETSTAANSSSVFGLYVVVLRGRERHSFGLWDSFLNVILCRRIAETKVLCGGKCIMYHCGFIFWATMIFGVGLETNS